jgi:hypothetical protein
MALLFINPTISVHFTEDLKYISSAWLHNMKGSFERISCLYKIFLVINKSRIFTYGKHLQLKLHFSTTIIFLDIIHRPAFI